MIQEIVDLLSQELKTYQKKQIETVLQLLGEGNTVPFIARYRKERTGSLDEVQIREIEERYHYLENLEKRKEEVIRLIDEQGKLTSSLASQIKTSTQLQQVEDIYRPYKQKRRTKATIAKEKGLGPLADLLKTFPEESLFYQEAKQYLSKEKELFTLEEVLAGVHEIVAEEIGDHASYRSWIRDYTFKTGQIMSQKKEKAEDPTKVYEMYYDYTEAVKKIVAHRILAMNRGEKEKVLKVTLEVSQVEIFNYLAGQLIPKANTNHPLASLIKTGYEDSYKRFIAPAIEREIRNKLTEQAEQQAIRIFGENLRHLLLQPPLKGKVVLGFDPAYRTGCKLAVVDETGKLEAIQVIYPHPPASQAKQQAAGQEFIDLVDKYQVEMIAIGNGTASRESETFVAEQLKQLDRHIYYVIVSEAGASVYSASDLARKEFPDLQVEERSAISIARRLQDPLAELVKIDPKSVGVGQYQHDVSQKKLTEELDFVVETAVNQVGVNVNTASPQLLQHVSGLTKTTAENIVTYREEWGSFTSRTQLKKVPRLGPKAYEQAVGFLRIFSGKDLFDQTGIHPESYPYANQLLKALNLDKQQLGTEEAKAKLENTSLKEMSQTLEIGIETLEDIVSGLVKPGRDLRDEMPAPLLRTDVLKMSDLQVGMKLEGTVRNVVDFGAFVDIGVKQDGLVHISKLKTGFVKHPTDVVSVGDIVTVWIEAVDEIKNRISLTMISKD